MNTTSHTIDPINFNKYRAEFRFPANTVLTSADMRLCNLGLYGVDGKKYSYSTGVKSLIKNITLFDGNQKLAGINNYNKYSAYKEYNSSNDSSRDKNNYLSGSARGFTTDLEDNTSSTKDYSDVFKQRIYNNDTKTTSSDENLAFKGIINLNKEFNFLSQTAVIPTTIFKNLRLVVEFETDYNKVILDVLGGGEVLTLMRPFVTCKEILDMEVAQKEVKAFIEKGVRYSDIENDLVPVQASAAVNGTQETKRKINGFLNKFVEDIVIQKEPTEATLTGQNTLKGLASVRQANEKINLTLNGKKVFPFDGLDSINKTLGVLNLCKGTHNRIEDFEVIDATPNSASAPESVEPFQSMDDYIGIKILDKVNDLQLNYSRQTSNIAQNSITTQALNMNVYGTVHKVLATDGTSYVVDYQ